MSPYPAVPIDAVQVCVFVCTVCMFVCIVCVLVCIVCVVCLLISTCAYCVYTCVYLCVCVCVLCCALRSQGPAGPQAVGKAPSLYTRQHS